MSAVAANPGLVSDCDMLLAALDILAGSGLLNWSGNTAITSWDGVTIDGPLNLPATVPAHASQMYSKNMLNLASLLISDGKVQLDRADEIVNGALITTGGEVVHPMVKEALALAEA